jgi:hypothetical protein
MKLVRRSLLMLAAASVLVLGQAAIPVDQLLTFIRSSLKLKHPDKQVAVYLDKLNLKDRLTQADMQQLLSEGIGPKTFEALERLRLKSTALPAPLPRAAPPPKPVVNIPAPDSIEQKKVIDAVREYALGYDQRLPDFICTQVTRRFYDPSGLEFWNAADTITAKLSYFQRKEEKKVIFVNGRYQEMDWDRVGGATSTGEFGSFLRDVFSSTSRAEFQWERWATLRGRRTHVFSYAVDQPNSRWALVWERNQVVYPGYRGLVYVDATDQIISRLTIEAVSIPESFPIQMAKTQLDYDFVDISGQRFFLPLRAEVRMRSEKMLTKNEIEFRTYRKFGAETNIILDEDLEPLPAEKLKEQPAAPPQR